MKTLLTVGLSLRCGLRSTTLWLFDEGLESLAYLLAKPVFPGGTLYRLSDDARDREVRRTMNNYRERS